MIIKQACKYELRPKAGQERLMRRFAGCCRFVWNKALELEKKAYEENGKRLGYYKLAGMLKEWKKEEETSFLAEAHSQILQQSLIDLNRAYENFFAQRARQPRYKKKGRHDAFRYPQGFKLDEEHSRIWLPKIGWVRYYNSRPVKGTIKQVIVSRCAGKWSVSIQTEREEPIHAHPSKSAIGIDMGVARFATFSDGSFIEPVNSFRKEEKKLAKLQKELARKEKYSRNWYKQIVRVQRHHHKIANIRKDFQSAKTTLLSCLKIWL